MDADFRQDAAIRPDAAEITAELCRILASDSFLRSRRLSAFLRFVAEHAVNGRSDEIKEYQIGIDVYGRGKAFDPKLDNIVRVEASRLRAKLREYYENGGRGNPVRVEIPRGTYVPVFRAAPTGEPDARVTPSPVPAVAPRSWIRWAMVAAVLIVIAGVLSPVLSWNGFGGLRRRRIAVIGLKEIPSGHTSAAWLSTALSELVTINLAETRQVQTVPADVAAEVRRDLGLEPADGLGLAALRRIRRNIGADLVVAGAYSNDAASGPDGIRLDLRVQDARSGETIAIASASGSVDNLFALTSQACSDLRRGLGLAAPGGTAANIASNAGAMRLYAQGLDALRRFDAREAQRLLQQSIQFDPSNPLAWSALSEVWHVLGYDAKARDTSHHAVMLAGHLGRVEQLAIEARSHMIVQEWPEAIRAYTAIWQMAPDSLDDGLRVADCQISGARAKDALVTLRKLRELSQPLGDDPRLDFAEARAYGATGEYRRALEPIRKAEQKARQRGQRLLFARARRFEAGLMGMLDLPGRFEVLAESRQLCEELGDRVCVISALRVEAINELHARPARARALYEHALAMARDAGSAVEEANIFEGLIVAETFLGDLAAAEQTCREEIDAAKKTGSPVAFLEYELGSINVRQGRLPQAHILYAQALDHAGPSHAEPTVSNTLIALSALLRLEGKPRQAAGRAREALEIVRRTGSDAGLFDALVVQGDALTDLGDWEGARVSYDEARKHVNGGSPQNAGEIEASWGWWCLGRGEAPEAERHLRLALQAFQSMAYPDRELSSQTVLVRALLAQNKIDEARQLAAEIAPAAKNTQDAEVRIRILLSEAQVAARRSDRAKALQSLNAALAEAKLLGYRELGYQALELQRAL